jgi:Right handed beta helix region
MLHSMLSAFRAPQRPVARLWAALAAAAIAPAAALGAALPAPPQTFDSSYVAPRGRIVNVPAGGNLQAVLDNAQLGDTIVVPAGAMFRGPIKLPNKPGSGWIYVVSSHLANLPPPGTRVGAANAANMPKIVAPQFWSAVLTVANSHHFRFVGIEFEPAPGTTETYGIVRIGNSDTSPATLPHHIVFDRCYVHGNPNVQTQRGIEMDGAYVAVVDSYISDFQEILTDTQALAAWNTTGPLQIRNNYIEAATENVMFGGADSRQAALVPTNIEIRDNLFYKNLSIIPTQFPMKNLLEFKSAQRVLVTGNVFQNNPAKSQAGFALVITPRNQNGTAPWSVTRDIAIVGNKLINVGSGINIAGHDTRPTLMTQRILLRDNVLGITGLYHADGRAFQFVSGGSDYTVTHNTIINSALPPATLVSDLAMAAYTPKINNFVFTNNLSTFTSYGFFGSGVSEGTRTLSTYFTNWTFSRNVLVGKAAGNYPAGNFFPANLAAVAFVNYAGGNYALAANSPYRNAGTDGMAVGDTDLP